MAYTNSPLVSYTLLSPNNSGQRTHSIDRITPHCVVGQCSVESLGSLFANPSRQASSNYGIGCDGRVGMYCEEKNRSWCSSSPANDQRAITIECASDNFAPYAFKEVVYNKLVDLCVDICQRNGKNKILWFNDMDTDLNYEPKANEMVLTVHRWTGLPNHPTSCPGDWMFSRMQDLADRVNTKLSGSPVPSPTPTPTPTPSNPAGDPTIVPISLPTISWEKKVWDFFYGKMNNSYAVAGLMGNMYGESGLKPDNLENVVERQNGLTDSQYTASVDNATYNKFESDGYGYGLIQWRTQTRKARMLDYSISVSKSIGDLDMQLNYMWQELNNTYAHVLKELKACKNIYDAAVIALKEYVQPAIQDEETKRKRTGYGLTYYNRYAGSSRPNSIPTNVPTPTVTPIPSQPSQPAQPSTPSTPTTTNDTEKKIWDYLYARIGNAYGVAGLMGNLWAESGLKSNNLQNSFEKKYGMTDDQYTAAVDNSQISEHDFVNDGSGYGLAQWTWWTRKQGLYTMLKRERKVSISDLDGQLDYLWQELTTSYVGVLNSIKIATSVREASDIVLLKFEKPADQSEQMKQTRASYSENFYKKYANRPSAVGGGTVTPTPAPSTAPSGISVSNGKYMYQGLDYAPVFDPTYYASRYDDLARTFGNNATGLFNHFVTYGMKECRQASADFNVITYRNKYADLRQVFGNDIPAYYKHYIEYGIKEGRTGV